MEKTGPMRMLEAATGKDVRQLIHEAVTRHGSAERAAEAMGLTSVSTLYKWVKLLGGEVDTRSTVHFRDFTPASQPEPDSRAPVSAAP